MIINNIKTGYTENLKMQNFKYFIQNFQLTLLKPSKYKGHKSIISRPFFKIVSGIVPNFIAKQFIHIVGKWGQLINFGGFRVNSSLVCMHYDFVLFIDLHQFMSSCSIQPKPHSNRQSIRRAGAWSVSFLCKSAIYPPLSCGPGLMKSTSTMG